MERLTKDVQSIKAQILDIRQKYEYVISVLENKEIIQSQQKKEALLDKKRKQLNYPFFSEELEKHIQDFKDCDRVNLLITEDDSKYKIVCIRLINSIKKSSINRLVEIEIEFPI